ncbi:MAG: hypothetical protein GY801_26675 [bacterium]|nr:hypothetical protein [bacterium]
MNTQEQILSKPHYFYPIRLLIECFNAGSLPNVRAIHIEPKYGRVAHIRYKDGSVRMLCGSGLGVNGHGSASVAKDKGYTKYFLDRLGYSTPPGKVFLMPKWVKTIEKNLSVYGVRQHSTIWDIPAYISHTIHYPCFIKPNNGAKGIGVHKCFHDADVQSVIEEYEKEGIDILLVEECIDLPCYRVDVVGERIFCCYLRSPLSVVGDGKNTIGELLVQKRDRFIQEGRPTVLQPDDPRICEKLQRMKRDFDSVLSIDEKLALHDFSNFPSGGDAEDFTERIDPYWKKLCVTLTKDMGLLLCGIDILCDDMESPQAEYRILEINSAPGLENYAALGEKQEMRVRKLYKSLFNENN